MPDNLENQRATDCHTYDKPLVVPLFRDAIDEYDPNTGEQVGASNKRCHTSTHSCFMLLDKTSKHIPEMIRLGFDQFYLLNN